MSGNYQAWNQDAPGGLTESAQAIAAGLAQAQSAVATTQLEAASFMAAYGAEVLPGHADVNAPGRQGDPDVERDAADG